MEVVSFLPFRGSEAMVHSCRRILLRQKINTLESESIIHQVSEFKLSVPVNLTCKFTRNRKSLEFTRNRKSLNLRVYQLIFRISLIQRIGKLCRCRKQQDITNASTKQASVSTDLAQYRKRQIGLGSRFHAHNNIKATDV